MRQKNNSIKSKITSRLLWSRICLGLALLFSLGASAQARLLETLEIDADRIVIDLGIIDHLKLTNSDSEQLRIHAENSRGVPRTELQDKGRTLYIGSVFTRQIEEEPVLADKLCSVEPVYPSFEIFIPRDKKVLVTIGKGNLYADRYQGDLDLKMEEGVVRLQDMQGEVSMKVDRGRIWVSGLDQRKVLAETSMGELVLQREDGTREEIEKYLEEEFGTPMRALKVSTVMGSIYLEQ